MKSKLAFVFLYIFYILALGIITEFTVRIIADHSSTVKFMTYSTYRAKNFDRIVDLESLLKSTDCSYRPGQVVNDFVINSHGFFSLELLYQKKKNDYRIVFLGDSFNIGAAPYKYNYIHLTGEKLNNNPQITIKHKIQTINLGIPCVGTSIYLKQLEIEGIRYQPDLIVVGFFVGNDFYDDKANVNTADQINRPKENKLFQLVAESRLISLFVNLYKTNFFMGYKPMAKKNTSGQVLGTWLKNTDTYNPFESRMPEDKYLGIKMGILPILHPDSTSYDNLDLIENNFKQIKQMSKKYSSDLLVIIIPDELQVNPKLLDEVSEKSRVNEKKLDMNLPQRTVIKILKKNEIAYLDLLPEFLKDPNRVKFYQPNDTHFNSFGNEKTAEVLSSDIKKIIKEKTKN